MIIDRLWSAIVGSNRDSRESSRTIRFEARIEAREADWKEEIRKERPSWLYAVTDITSYAEDPSARDEGVGGPLVIAGGRWVIINDRLPWRLTHVKHARGGARARARARKKMRLGRHAIVDRGGIVIRGLTAVPGIARRLAHRRRCRPGDGGDGSGDDR